MDRVKVRLTSGVGDVVRELRYPWFSNVFLLSRLGLDGIYHAGYAVVDRATMTIILTAPSMTTAIYQLCEFLERNSQADVDNLIALIDETNTLSTDDG